MKVIKKALVLVVSLLVTSEMIFASPVGYVERIGGSDLTNAFGSLMFVLENPTSGEPIARAEISIPSGFSTASAGGYVSVVGRGSGIVDTSGPIMVNFSTPLMPGSSAFIVITNVQNPSSTGSYVWTMTAYGIGDNPISVGAKPGKTLSLSVVSSLGFRSIPYGRVVFTSGNAAANTGLKVVNNANTWLTYIIYHPYDAGDAIRRVILSIPPAFATVAGTVLTITNLTTGVQLTNFTVGAIGAGLPKTFYLSVPPVPPGNVLLITLSVMTLPAAAGNYDWECYVEGTSGQIVRVLDMPGFTAPQRVVAIAAPAAGWYGDVYPFFDITTRTMGWPTAGSSNNVYRMVFWNTAAWAAGNNPRISFPSGFDPSAGAVVSVQANGAGFGSSMLANIGGTWWVSNVITGAGAANNNIFVSITNVVNSSAGSHTFGMAAGGSAVSTTTGYDRVVNVVPHLFTNVPMFGISIIGGSTNTNDVSIYLVVVSNPANSGDAVDRVEITIPAGYTYASVDQSLVTLLNSSGQVSSAVVTTQPTPTTSGKVTVTLSSASPLGEGGSMYIPITVTNPSTAGARVWSCVVSGLRDVTNLSAGVISSMTNRVVIVATAPPSDGTNYVPGNAVVTNTSSDNLAWMITTNGTFNGTSIVTIVATTNVPAATMAQSNEYIFIGNVYEFSSSLSLQKPVRVRLYFSNANTNLITSTNVVANFKLARYDEALKEWVLLASSIVGDGYVEVYTLSLGKYRIWEFKGTGGTGGPTNVFLVGKSSGGNYSWDLGKLRIEIPQNSLQVDGYLSIDTVDKNNPAYKSLPNHLVDIIGKQYSIILTSAITKPVTVTIHYSDEEVKGRVIDRLSLAYYDETEKKWIVVPSTVDKENKKVSAKTYHFSLWTLVEDRTPTSDLVSGVYVYPNPVKDELRISFSLNQDSRIIIEVYDFAGRKVATLENGKVVDVGLYETRWNLTSDARVKLPNGVYFVKVYAQSVDLRKSFNNVYKVYISK
ncbi:MAG: DUF2808 domain-containing protein [Brevinematia bacterium]